MINDKDRQEEQSQQRNAEREELQQATQRFLRSLFRTGVNVALLPVNRLPREPRQHFQAAGREFTHGWAALIREFADSLEELAEDASSRTHLGEAAHPTREAMEGQNT
jgi:hypothetical protein